MKNSSKPSRQTRCFLCGGDTDQLVAGHIWPKFAYKKYAADRQSGGSFIDLGRQSITNRQQKKHWFCCVCDNEVLGGYEKCAAKICDHLGKHPGKPVSYESGFFKFLVSISWRVSQYYLGFSVRNSASLGPDLKKPCQRWRDILRDRATESRPYSQHLFVVFDRDTVSHLGMGAEIFSDRRVVYSQIGPLHIFGLLDRKHLNLADIEIWERSEIRPDGGEITPLSKWEPGKNITIDCFGVLRYSHNWKMKHVAQFHEKQLAK